MYAHLRIARPVTDLLRLTDMYQRGLGLQWLGAFEDHAGFDGVMLGKPGMPYHFEFTHCRMHPVTPTPTEEDLLVLYVPDEDAWTGQCQALLAAGFKETQPFNPYWAQRGRTFLDVDGYHIVVERAAWSPVVV